MWLVSRDLRAIKARLVLKEKQAPKVLRAIQALKVIKVIRVLKAPKGIRVLTDSAQKRSTMTSLRAWKHYRIRRSNKGVFENGPTKLKAAYTSGPLIGGQSAQGVHGVGGGGNKR